MTERKTKFCVDCGVHLSVDHFYPIRAKDEKNVRWSKYCKKHTKERRRAREDKASSKNIPDGMIEPAKSADSSGSALPALVNIGKNESLDFSVWEDTYNKELSHSEKTEIEVNLMAFLTLLAEARNCEKGEFVELSKNK